MTWQDTLAALLFMGMVVLLFYLVVRWAEPERDPDSAILIEERIHPLPSSAIICNRAIPPQVRPYKGVTFA